MSEETAGGPETAAGLADTGGLALDLAIEEARSNPALQSEVAAFLRNQSSLIDIQKHHLHEQYKHLHLSVWEKQLGVLLRLATAVVGIAFATAVAVMIWDAAHSKGLLIESFSVPADMSARGLTGQTVAAQMLDKLTAMQSATQSYRAPQSYANNWGDDIKVEIPETGVSIGELRRFLRDWLGHDTHISGEVWRTDNGIAISARPGGEGGAIFAGPQSEFDALLQKAAEHVYAQTQPFRYGNYLRPQGRFRESHASYLKLTTSDTVRERSWAWYGIGVLDAVWQGKNVEGLWGYHKAVAANPDLTIAWSGIGASELQRGHLEAGLAAYRKVEELISRGGMADIAPRSVDYVRLQWTHRKPQLVGDYGEAIRRARLGAALPDQQGFTIDFRVTMARSLASQHDISAARAAIHNLSRRPSFSNLSLRATAPMQVEAGGENWPGVLQTEAAGERMLAGNTRPDTAVVIGAQLRPWAALAKAKLGDVAGAEALIATTQADCYDCVRIRGTIAAMANKPGESDAWFARAIHDAPSIPFAHADWGRALLERGKPDEAIAQFTLANQKGPKFADPLAFWGEALMAKNQSHRALAKFADAEKYAPNWGRLHLKWGQALAHSGNKVEAAKHFARAAALDLTPSEKSELARMAPRV